MENKFDYIFKHITDFEELVKGSKSPFQIYSGGFMICLSGECKVVIDTKQYNIKKWDIIVAFPYSVVQALESSSDFECVVIGAGGDFFTSIQIPNKSGYFTDIKSHPSVSLTGSEVENLLSLKNMLVKTHLKCNHLFVNEIKESILTIILYEIANIYNNRKPNYEVKKSREDMIFHKFIFQIFNDFKSERSLGYYAQKQQITPSHLSRVVKKASGRPASDWLVDCVIGNIKFRLKDKFIPISDISDEFNFANSSFFSQYFKKYTGLTPREFRARI